VLFAGACGEESQPSPDRCQLLPDESFRVLKQTLSDHRGHPFLAGSTAQALTAEGGTLAALAPEVHPRLWLVKELNFRNFLKN
jgi:hypothetical protein